MAQQDTINTEIRLLHTVQEVREFRLDCVLKNKSVGLVPTMGALHAGHCSLVKQSLAQNDVTIVSIFVNPSQFSPTEDLSSYPRTLQGDLDLLATLPGTVSAVFLPSVEEMYPNGITLDAATQTGAFVTVQGLSEQLEGASRPQFFKGVATVVTKLLNIVTPTRAYFGAKDIQQTIVVKRMVQDLLLPSDIIVLPTVRESNGLALSSRNAYLSAEIKDQSTIIYKALHAGEVLYTEEGVTDSAAILEKIQTTWKPYLDGSINSFVLDYVKINHPQSLDELDVIDTKVGAIISTAIKVPKADGGEARLIDNVVLDPR